MSVDLCCEFKTWLFSLGFAGENVPDDKILEEFEKLSPPEMRDIWRNVINHVLSVGQSRYIKKVLLLEELKKRSKLNGKTIKIPENLKIVSDLQGFDQYDKLNKQLKVRKSAIHDIKCKTDEVKDKISTLTEKRNTLLEEKENHSHMLTMLQLKTKSYGKLMEELKDIHECLAYANSFWNPVESINSVSPSKEIMENLLSEVNEFGKRRCYLNDTELLVEQKKLVNNVYNSALGISPSELQKKVVNLLGETVGTLLKLTDHLNIKKESQSIKNLDQELTEMRKRYVHIYIDCRCMLSKVKKLEEKIQQQLNRVISLFAKECNNDNGDDDKRMMQTWLDTEHLKHQMTARYKYLLRMEKIVNNENISNVSFDLTNPVERENFFRSIQNYQSQLVTLKQEISNNLGYLSEKSVHMFINFQNYCKNKVYNFVEQNFQIKSADFSVRLFNSLKNEISLLEKLQLRSFIDQNINLCNLPYPHNDIFESTRKSNFLIHLRETSENFEKSVNELSFENDTLVNKVQKIRIEEKHFMSLIQQLLMKSKTNLDMSEEEAKTCSKNVELWTNFNINELIPKHLVIDDRTFSEWQERYRVYITRLLK